MRRMERDQAVMLYSGQRGGWGTREGGGSGTRSREGRGVRGRRGPGIGTKGKGK